jgi:hypothetical protein
VEDLKVEGQQNRPRWAGKVEGSYGQSPRAKSPTRDEERAHRPGRKRAGTLDTDGALNVPLRQKEGGL